MAAADSARWAVEDLGVQAHGDCWIALAHCSDPQTGREGALGSLSRGGFVVIDPEGRSGRQVRPPSEWVAQRSGTEIWAITQAPGGAVFAATSYSVGAADAVLRWDWTGNTATIAAELPFPHCLSMDSQADGTLYLGDHSGNTLWQLTLAGDLAEVRGFAEFGDYLRQLCCGADGWLYALETDHQQPCVVAYHPERGECRRLPGSRLLKDAHGRVLAGSQRYGQLCWRECRDGESHEIGADSVQLANTERAICELPMPAEPTSLAFADGSWISRLRGREGEDSIFEVEFDLSPLRIFSVAAGGGRIWGGTFIPLSLFSYETASGTTRFHENPTTTIGEIYNMVWSGGKLYVASYTGAELCRYDPAQPWQMDRSVNANPAQLGKIKEDGLPLQRPHGRALAPDGTVFFAAHGSYGCVASGIARIDPSTDRVTRWIYEDTHFNALVYLPGRQQLLVSERRDGEDGIRFTFICPSSGEVVESEIVIADAGAVTSWLVDGEHAVYGLHNHRATIFRYTLGEGITAILPELDVGDHCYNMLIDGPDGRIWGLTNRCVFAVARDLSAAEQLAAYDDHAGRNFYRFGMCIGDDGHVYFPNGCHLMRVVQRR
jgi:hypothetical protein